MIGTRDMAFPRLNAFSYWIFVFSGIFLYAGFVVRARTRRRLVRVHAADRPDVLTRGEPRLLGTRRRVRRDLDDGRCGQLHRHRREDARPGDDVEPASDLRLGDARVLVHGALRRSLGDARRRPARAGPALRDAVLRPRSRGQRPALPAPLLVLGPSRGVHPVRPRDRDDVDGDPGLLATPARRIPLDRPGAARHRLHELRRVGAPHVRDRPARARLGTASRRSASSS